ncbi:ABC transporter ATP-binding protein [soil metagenome]
MTTVLSNNATTPVLEVQALRKVYGDGKRSNVAIADVSFKVEQGQIVCIVGPSGCGKTTLLKCLSGLSRPTSGRSLLDGVPITAPPRDLAFVFQDYSRSLFPWMTVEQNVRLPLLDKGIRRSEIDRRASRAIESVNLSAHALKKPHQLSGGMQQRVAIARALAYEPEVMLMDEPFASVDAQTRAELEDLVLALRDEYKMTVLFITHDIDEAVYVADRVVVLNPSPTTVREVVEIDLPAPRDQIATKELASFVHLRSHVYGLVRNRWGEDDADGAEPRQLSRPATAGELVEARDE